MQNQESPKNTARTDEIKENGMRDIAELFGHGRMTVEEKRSYLENHKEILFHNPDFVSMESYEALFRTLDLDGATVIDTGAGYAVSLGDGGGLSPKIRALNTINPHMTLIPVDYEHDRSKSWLLLDTQIEADNNNISLEPVTADVTRLPFADGSIDGYLSSNLVNEPRKLESERVFVTRMFKEAYRVLKPGGFLILSSFGYFWWKLKSGMIIYNDNIDVEEIIEKEQLRKILVESGFTNIQDIELSREALEKSVHERLERRDDAIETGVHEACAFIAKKEG